MSDPVWKLHLSRLKTATIQALTLDTLPEWMAENVYLNGAPYSFIDHEFQYQILRDPSREIITRKCSQIGLTTLAMCRALAFLNIIEGSTIIYTLPTANFARQFTQTRLDPLIDSSPALAAARHKTTDNAEVKRFNNSFLYVKGTVGSSAAISVPADGIFNDELDFSDLEVVSNYQSRLTHSRWKLKQQFSTPTVEGYGISAAFAASRRFFNFCKCDHCNHFFLPSYFDHVKLPGYNDDLRGITKDNLHRYDVKAAHLECPSCGKEPSMQPEHRTWVQENLDDNFEAAGYQIQPFDAPNVITPADLIISSTKYKRYADFINFSLGLPAEDKESTLSLDELEQCVLPRSDVGWGVHVMGIDMGLFCHVMVGFVDPGGRLVVVHTEVVPVSEIRKRKAELAHKYHVAITVMDTQPYVETVLNLQENDVNLYGAIYVTSKNMEPYSVKRKEEDKEEAILSQRQVNINRNKAFDALMGDIRQGRWFLMQDENTEMVKRHLTDMKRVRENDKDEEPTYVWRKSAKGEDHFHHSLLYTWIAARMRGASQSMIVLPSVVGRFKVSS